MFYFGEKPRITQFYPQNYQKKDLFIFDPLINTKINDFMLRKNNYTVVFYDYLDNTNIYAVTKNIT